MAKLAIEATSGGVEKPSYEQLIDIPFSQVSHDVRHATIVFKYFLNELSTLCDEVQPAIEDLRRKLRIDASQVPEEERERVVRLTFGLFTRPDILFADTLTQEQKVFSASLQHDIALSILTVQSGHSTDWYTDMVHTVVNKQTLVSSRVGNSLLRKFWAGVRSEIGLIRALSRAGLKVYIPNPQDPQACASLDIANSIDVIAQDPVTGTILLLDAKGGGIPSMPEGSQQRFHPEELFDYKAQVVVANETNALVMEALKQIAIDTQDPSRNISDKLMERPLLYAKVYIPGTLDINNWVQLAFRGLRSPELRRGYLTSFGKLVDSEEQKVISSIEKLISMNGIQIRNKTSLVDEMRS